MLLPVQILVWSDSMYRLQQAQILVVHDDVSVYSVTTVNGGRCGIRRK
ncbi:MAG TPA: hypothetical protein QF611_12680 [Pseudomonadales bacterium]|nr:hypothetical protein [Pseudomonadales bacterium]